MEPLTFLSGHYLAPEQLTGSRFVPLSLSACHAIGAVKGTRLGLRQYLPTLEHGSFEAAHRKVLEAGDRHLAAHPMGGGYKNIGPFGLFAYDLRLHLETLCLYKQAFQNLLRDLRPSAIRHIGSRVRSMDCITVGQFAELPVHRMFDTLLRETAAEAGIAYEADFTTYDLLPGQKLIPEETRPTLAGPGKQTIRTNSRAPVDATAFFAQTSWGLVYYSQLFTRVISEAPQVYKQDVAPNMKKRDGLDMKGLLEALTDAMGGITQLFGTDMAHMCKPAYSRFTDRIPAILSFAAAWKRYFDEHEIRYVFSANLAAPHERSMLLPCMNGSSTRSVIMRHGDCLLDATIWRAEELKTSHIQLTNDTLNARHFEREAQKADAPSKPVCNDVFHLMLKRAPGHPLLPASPIKKMLASGIMLGAMARDAVRRHIPKARPRLLYIPSTLFFPHLYSEELAPMLEEVYDTQEAILAYLNEADYEVVCKLYPEGKTFTSPKQYPMKFLGPSQFPNITFSEKSTVQALRQADICLLDNPSTSFWETIALQVPCQCLVQNTLRLRQDRLADYDPYLTFFDTADQIPTLLDDLLGNNRFYSGPKSRLGFTTMPREALARLFLNHLPANGVNQ